MAFGEHLKREREMRGVSLEEISQATRIAPRFLTAIENEQWDKLPGGVFNRGFIRSIAHYLGLDEDSMVAEYALHTKGRAEPGVVGDPPDKPESRWRQVLVLIAFAAIVVAVGWFAIKYLLPRAVAYMHQRDENSSSFTRADSDSVQTPANTAPTTAPPSADSSPSPATVKPEPAKNPLTLKLEAARPADVTIVADGKVSFAGHMATGEIKQFAAAGAIQIASSEASAVLIDLNGQIVVLPGQPNLPSSITLTAKDLQSTSGASH